GVPARACSCRGGQRDIFSGRLGQNGGLRRCAVRQGHHVGSPTEDGHVAERRRRDGGQVRRRLRPGRVEQRGCSEFLRTPHPPLSLRSTPAATGGRSRGKRRNPLSRRASTSSGSSSSSSSSTTTGSPAPLERTTVGENGQSPM
ncbi:unnamed protein product, partial [Ectocarpus fasciculatus]